MTFPISNSPSVVEANALPPLPADLAHELTELSSLGKILLGLYQGEKSRQEQADSAYLEKLEDSMRNTARALKKKLKRAAGIESLNPALTKKSRSTLYQFDGPTRLFYQALMSDKDSSDVTVMVGGRAHFCHRVILGQSSLLKSLIDKQMKNSSSLAPAETVTLIISELSEKAFLFLRNVFYGGDVSATIEEGCFFDIFLYGSEDVQSKCVEVLSQILRESNCFLFLRQFSSVAGPGYPLESLFTDCPGFQQRLKEVYEKILKFICRRAQVTFKQDAFLKLSEPVVRSLAENEHLLISESGLFQAIYSWLLHLPERREDRELVERMMGLVSFEEIPAIELWGNVRTASIDGRPLFEENKFQRIWLEAVRKQEGQSAYFHYCTKRACLLWLQAEQQKDLHVEYLGDDTAIVSWKTPIQDYFASGATAASETFELAGAVWQLSLKCFHLSVKRLNVSLTLLKSETRSILSVDTWIALVSQNTVKTKKGMGSRMEGQFHSKLENIALFARAKSQCTKEAVFAYPPDHFFKDSSLSIQARIEVIPASG